MNRTLIAVVAGLGCVAVAIPVVLSLSALRPLDAPLRVATMTSLPLGFGAGDIADVLNGRAEPAAMTRAVSPVMQLNFIETPDAAVLMHSDLLLLAHPRAMSGEAMVAIDAWVRGGGRAIILADPLSSWPSPYALGDPRRPAITSHLTPLLAHWGLTLDLDGADAARDVQLVDKDYTLQLSSAGRFTTTTTACHLCGDRRIAECTIGRGRALLVADADFLDEPHWQSGDDAPRWLADRALALARSEQLAAERRPWFD